MSDYDSYGLAYQFTVDYGAGSKSCIIAVKPSNNNREIAFEQLKTSIKAVKSNSAEGTAKAGNKLTKDEEGLFTYTAGPYKVEVITPEIIDCYDNGHITKKNLKEIHLEEFMKFEQVVKLLIAKRAAQDLLPKQIAELERVMPLVKDKAQAKNGGNFKRKFEAEKLAKEMLEAEIMKLREALAAACKPAA